MFNNISQKIFVKDSKIFDSIIFAGHDGYSEGVSDEYRAQNSSPRSYTEPPATPVSSGYLSSMQPPPVGSTGMPTSPGIFNSASTSKISISSDVHIATTSTLIDP